MAAGAAVSVLLRVLVSNTSLNLGLISPMPSGTYTWKMVALLMSATGKVRVTALLSALNVLGVSTKLPSLFWYLSSLSMSMVMYSVPCQVMLAVMVPPVTVRVAFSVRNLSLIHI